MAEDLTKLKLPELREVARKRGIKPVYGINKAQLIERLQSIEREVQSEDNKSKEKAEKASKSKPTTKSKTTTRNEPSESAKPAQKAVQESAEINEPTQKVPQKPEENQEFEQKVTEKSDENSKSAQQAVLEPSKILKPVRKASESKPIQPIPSKVKVETRNIPTAAGTIYVSPDGFGFIDCGSENPANKRSIYIPKSFVQDHNLKTGDYVKGYFRQPRGTEKNQTLTVVLEVKSKPEEKAKIPEPVVYQKQSQTTTRKPVQTSANGKNDENAVSTVPALPAPKVTVPFENLTPIFPDSRLQLETTSNSSIAMRIMDLVCPIGKGQRGLIVAPPKAGKTTLLKDIAASIIKNHPEEHLMVLLIDERPEEVTDFKESVVSPSTEVFFSTFDELPEHHISVAETVLNRAKKLVSDGKDVLILLDSITRLVRANNLQVNASGRTLSGGLDSAALPFPKKFLGAARNIRNGGSLTIIATALVETGSRLDDVVYEEFKGTGNMEVVLDRRLAERRVFPAIDISKSGTRRDDLLLDEDEQKAVQIIHRSINSGNSRVDDGTEQIIALMKQTKTNADAVQLILKARKLPETPTTRKMPISAVRNYQLLQE